MPDLQPKYNIMRSLLKIGSTALSIPDLVIHIPSALFPMNPQVDDYIKMAKKWQEEFREFRKILIECGLTEELKWYKPCYTFRESNIVIIQGFKSHSALMFCKGALLKDPHKLLTKPGENTQSARWIRFANVQEIIKLEPILKATILEAIEAEKAGLKVYFKKTSEFQIPEELQNKLDESPTFKAAFQSLTPGRQRGYILYFSAPKQSKTRVSRIEKSLPQILQGKGINDR